MEDVLAAPPGTSVTTFGSDGSTVVSEALPIPDVIVHVSISSGGLCGVASNQLIIGDVPIVKDERHAVGVGIYDDASAPTHNLHCVLRLRGGGNAATNLDSDDDSNADVKPYVSDGHTNGEQRAACDPFNVDVATGGGACVGVIRALPAQFVNTSCTIKCLLAFNCILHMYAANSAIHSPT